MKKKYTNKNKKQPKSRQPNSKMKFACKGKGCIHSPNHTLLTSAAI